MKGIFFKGELIALCDEVRYVAKGANEVYLRTKKEEAEAISVRGTLYPVKEVTVQNVDGVSILFDAAAKAESAGRSVDSIQDAICESDAALDERLTSIEDAICELDEKLGGE